MDRLTSMAVFVRAVDAGSFAAAATALGLSAPMVGKHVRFLEDRLGVRLINRTTRRQSLTDVGRSYYDRCRQLLAEAEAADAMAADLNADPAGRLRVSLPVVFGRRCVAPLLLELASRHPRLELDLSFTDRPVDLMDDGFDLAVRNGPLGEWSGLVARKIAQQRMLVCAAPGYLQRHGVPTGLDDLAGHQAVAYGRGGRAKAWIFPGDDGPPHLAMPAVRLLLDDLEAMADAAVAGMGLAWLPRWLVRDRLDSGALRQVLTDAPALVMDSFALWLESPHVPARVRVAVDALATGLPRLAL